MQVVLFPYDNDDDPTNPTVLDSDIQWLKAHPNVRFSVNGYASSRGPLIYNLNLSQRRADWIKGFMISRGIAENRIKIAVGWGELYPVCPERTDECWALRTSAYAFVTPRNDINKRGRLGYGTLTSLSTVHPTAEVPVLLNVPDSRDLTQL